MSNILFPKQGVILDACCIINLCASGYMQSILEAVPSQIGVAAYVYEKEVLRIYAGPDEDITREVQQVDLRPFADSGLLEVVSTDDELERLVVNFSVARIDSGEAISAAIAVHRAWSFGTDDKSAIAFLTQNFPQLHLLSTPDLLKHWVDSVHPESSMVSAMLKNVRRRAKYEPHAKHPLYAWWKACVAEQSELL